MGRILVPLTKIDFTDSNIARFQDNVATALTPLQNSTLIGGILLTSIVNKASVNYVSLTSGQDNIISHSLGHAPSLILFFAPNVNSTLWSPAVAATTQSIVQGTNSSSTQVNLRCSSTCTVSVWIS
jgi:hypothetical protein